MSTYVPSQSNLSVAIHDVGLADIIKEALRSFALGFNCHAIATVKAFDATKQTIQAQICYQKTYLKKVNGVYQEQAVPYDLMINVPVIILKGGGAYLSFPIAVGDTCLLLFNDRDIDIWLTSGQITPPNTDRVHDLTDAIALVGLNNYQTAISGYDTTRAMLKNSNAYVGVSPNKVKVANSSTTLNTQLQALVGTLQNLCSQIQALTVTCAAPGNPSSIPINAGSFATISSQLSTIGTQLGGLLE